MLALSRKEGESIILKTATEETVTITLTKYRGIQTILGIEAPKSIKILRSELVGLE
jgi:carbon storage regulator CsrA